MLQHLRLFFGVFLGRKGAQFGEHGEEVRIGIQTLNERRIALLGRFAIFAGKKSDVAIDILAPGAVFSQQKVTQAIPLRVIVQVANIGDMFSAINFESGSTLPHAWLRTATSSRARPGLPANSD